MFQTFLKYQFNYVLRRNVKNVKQARDELCQAQLKLNSSWDWALLKYLKILLTRLTSPNPLAATSQNCQLRSTTPKDSVWSTYYQLSNTSFVPILYQQSDRLHDT